MFKKELEHLCEIGVLEPCGPSDWALPTFIIPKKDGRVRWVSNFRALNKVLKRKIYPIPRIHELLCKRKGYKTKLDISMQYYTFDLDEESKDYCVIATPFGLYRYLKMPMGISPASDISQHAMELTLKGVKEADAYFDDVKCWRESWSQHLVTLERTLSRLEEAGFSINPLKCEWGVQEQTG